MQDLFIGLMSGTSMDGIDTALVDFSNQQTQLIGQHSHSIPTELKHRLQQLALDAPTMSLDILGEADAELGELFADACLTLLEQTGHQPSEIKAIGSHGQTIRHRPDLKYPFSLQIADANRIAHKTGITTIADFRRRDMAASGEGAPLAPAFHKAMFSSHEKNRGILNIGGIANITYLPRAPQNRCFGFDTGPGNMLMDSWVQKHQLEAFDREGHWAASGSPHEALVDRLMNDPYVLAAPPKSTGREHYHLKWLQAYLQVFPDLKPEDVQASLCCFTTLSIQYAIEHFVPDIDELIICGGGVHNTHLLTQIRRALPGIDISSSEQHHLHPDWVEAVAFAWLAKQTLEGKTGNLPDVTGANESVVLGAIHLA